VVVGQDPFEYTFEVVIWGSHLDVLPHRNERVLRRAHPLGLELGAMYRAAARPGARDRRDPSLLG
jgi:hypothetical protein